ncbi:MAG: hypothetical protein WCO42_07295 [bacterium]
MKGNIIFAAFLGVGVSLCAGSRANAEGQYIDVFMDGLSKPTEPRHESRDRDDARYDSRHPDGDRSHSRPERGRTDPDVIVRRAYEDILNREPDQQGLRTYRSRIIDDNWTEQDVRNDLRKSAERAGRTPAAADVIIRRAYQDILGREPDPSGLATYRAKLLNENWSERDVRSDLKKSAEVRSKSAAPNEKHRK